MNKNISSSSDHSSENLPPKKRLKAFYKAAVEAKISERMIRSFLCERKEEQEELSNQWDALKPPQKAFIQLCNQVAEIVPNADRRRLRRLWEEFSCPLPSLEQCEKWESVQKPSSPLREPAGDSPRPSYNDNKRSPMNPVLSTEVRQVSLEYKEKYKDLPVPQKVIALVDDYKGIQLTTNSNHQKNTFDRSGKQVSVSRANRPYFIAIASLLNQYEKDLPTAHLSLDTIGVSPDSIETERDRFGRLAPIAARIVEEHSQDEFTETTADFGAKLLPFFDAALSLLYGEQTNSVLPKIVQDLCKESTSPTSKFYPVRQFLESLERYEGKLVWPNTRRTSGSTHFVRKYDLALLVYHLKLKDGFRFPLEEWASYARESFVWNDHSAVSNNELRRYISDERKSRKVDELKDSTVVRLIRNLYE